MSKRGQAAMEFLMTYGWAILAVLITIAALAYFGVLNPARFLPESCTLFPGIACIDSSANNVGVTLTVRNGLGQNLNPFIISIPGCPGSASADNGLSDGEKETIILTCNSGPPNPGFVTNSKLKKDIDVTYTATSVSHTRKGSILTAVENGYIANGGFEYFTGLNPFYWTASGTGTGSLDSTTSHTGSNSFKLIVTSGGGDTFTVSESFAFTLPAGTYVISFWAKGSPSSLPPTTLRAVLRDAADTPMSSSPTCGSSTFLNVGTDWAQYSWTCTTSTGLPSSGLLSIYFGFEDAVTFWIDDVEVKKV